MNMQCDQVPACKAHLFSGMPQTADACLNVHVYKKIYLYKIYLYKIYLYKIYLYKILTNYILMKIYRYQC